MFPIRDHNPSERIPYVTYTLMAINILVFALVNFQEPAAINAVYYDYAMIPALISNGENYFSIISSMFLHGGFMHILGNMVFLFIFGDNVEDKMGHLPFLFFYLVCGIAAALAQYVVEVNSTIPVVGASGAIAGVMGGYLLLFPKAKVDIFIFFIIIIRIIPVPSFIMLGLWFALQLFSGVTVPTEGGGVAYWAHAGGFAFGALLTLPLWLRLGGPRFWHQTDYHPDHPEARYDMIRSRIPNVRRK